MDVCDRVNDDPENGSAQAVSIIQKRLEGDVANRQLYSLTLISALAQNCGSKMHRELASRSFTGHLLEMASENRIHHAVKSRVMEVMETLSREFHGDPSLRQMEDAFNMVKQQNPNLAPPAVPQKHQLTEAERQQEEDDLQLALKLSLQDAAPSAYSLYQPKNESSNQLQSQPQQQQQQSQQSQQQQPQQKQTETAKGKTAATVNRVRALYDLSSDDPNELSFRRGDVITVIESVYRDWWKGSLKGNVGIFPLNYVTPIPDPTPEELEQEARDESEVFAEARNVEKLLAILSSIDGPGSAGAAEDEELQRLYRSTQAVRPRLIKLIEKYSQKRDDLIDLDKRFMAARKTYDQLIETSLSQIPANPLSYSSSAPFVQPPLQQQQQQVPFQTPSQQHQPLYGSQAPITSQPTGSYNNLSSSSQNQNLPSTTQPQQSSYLTSQSTGYQSNQPGSYQPSGGYQNSQTPNAYQNTQPSNNGYQNQPNQPNQQQQHNGPYQTSQPTGSYQTSQPTGGYSSGNNNNTNTSNNTYNQGGYQQPLQSQPTGSTSSFLPSLQPQPASSTSPYSQQPQQQKQSQQQQSNVISQSPPTSVPPAGMPLGYSTSEPSQQSQNQQTSNFIVPAGSDLRNQSYGY